jgi:glycosyltransferase involved in cell wall biosynthesis
VSDFARRIVIINDFAVARGGATVLALELAHRLRRAGRDVTFFTGDNGENAELAASGAEIVAVRGQRLLEAPGVSVVTGVYNARAKNALSKWIANNDGPGVIYHVNVWSQILSPSIFAALRPVAARAVVTAHDFFLACPNGNYTNYPKSKACALTPMSPQCLLSNCDKRSYAHKVWRVMRQAALRAILDWRTAPFTALAIQEGMIPLLERGGVPAHRIAVLRNPADRLGLQRVEAENNSEVFFVGRLDTEKGADLLAAAARAAGMRLRVIGEGPALDAVRAANPEAIFEGWRTKNEIATFFKSARLLVMPTRCIEPFGLAAAEALRVGVPVVASRSSLIAGDLERYGMGLAVDVFDPAAFAATLRRLAADDAGVRAMSVSAYENAGKIANSFDEWTSAHLELYDRLARASHAPGMSAPSSREFVPAKASHA